MVKILYELRVVIKQLYRFGNWMSFAAGDQGRVWLHDG
jgi:hypothetical protein